MNDYTKLVEDLRGKFIAYDVTGNRNSNSAQLYKDAADAIETLRAQLPKRGEWIMDGRYTRHCSICNESVAWPEKYCPNCGAKMEVQE